MLIKTVSMIIHEACIKTCQIVHPPLWIYCMLLHPSPHTWL